MTGAASGIGRAITVALAQEGVNLVITDHDATGLTATEERAAREGVTVTTCLCDLTQPAEITAMLNRLFEAAPLHILVNCAGIAVFGQQRSISDADWRNLMAVNLLAPMQITTELLNRLARTDEAHIVNVSSIFGLVPVRELAAYQASKYGLVGFTLALRNDYHRENFGVSVICPGLVTTPMVAEGGPSKIYSKRPRLPEWLYTTPEHVADTTIKAIKRDKGLVVVTLLARVIWRLNRFFPGLVDLLNRESWRSRGPIIPPGET
ncbi:SDR family oxidoreductase [uncultured Bradyrhizobium sp.]|uniref:SDR family NAD(P)-dependent oxidoreductase n=1 Tax=uncultured Bradyrhizobium sp. TaxID=199684 RepID=UPI002604F630|nr:SDR family oxidoreductase [uncultured Bradyrhizobium sp.]